MGTENINLHVRDREACQQKPIVRLLGDSHNPDLAFPTHYSRLLGRTFV